MKGSVTTVRSLSGFKQKFVVHICFYCPSISLGFVGVTRHEAQQWCLGHAFELVELNPQELPDEDGAFKRQKIN